MQKQGNPSSGFLLERRSRSASGKAGTVSAKTKQGSKKGAEPVLDGDIRPLGVDAFIEVLNRYCRRFLRDGKNFSLASLRILEYERVKSTDGNELADQLDRLGANVVCSELRGEDRICFVGPAQYLVLMPGTIYDDAHRAMERAAVAIGEKSLRQRSHLVRPSASFMVTSPSNVGDALGGGSDTIVDTETLLGDIGYTLGTHNVLIDRTVRDGTGDGDACKVFAGNFATWFERYKSVGERLTDTWSTGDQDVVLRVWEPLADTVSGVNHEALLRRLRALQSIEHPAFNRVTDFFITPDWKVSLISSKVEGLDLRGGASKKSRKQVADSLEHATDLTILNWTIQICNALIAAQGMSPPLVLSSFSKLKVTLSPKDRIVLSDYEPEYLQTFFDELATQDRKVKKTNGFVSELAEFALELVKLKDEWRAGAGKQNAAKSKSDAKSDAPISDAPKSDAPLQDFRNLLSTLSAHQENGEKFSLYKLRSTLKATQDASS